MGVNKKLQVLLQVVMVIAVINKASATTPNLGQLKELVRYYLVPDFQKGGLVEQGNQQFAVAILQPGKAWMRFLYDPSVKNDGEKPIINANNPLSPPGANNLGNYLAARPNMGVHSETQILQHIDDLYNGYVQMRKSKVPTKPQALLLYSWIVPCKTCTDALYDKLTKDSKFKSIPIKVIAFTTLGGCSSSNCDVNYTRQKFKNSGIEVVWVSVYEEQKEIENLLAQLIAE